MATFAAWALGLFALSRLPWVAQNLVLPFAALQQRLASVLAGPPAQAVLVDASCSGTDVLALCAGAMLAYPARWSARLRGTTWALAFLLGLNVARIGTVSLVVDRPTLFEILHVYVWPTVLVLAAVGCVFVWIRGQDAGERDGAPASLPAWAPRMLGWTAALVGVYFVALAWLRQGDLLGRATDWVALTAAPLIGATGAEVTVSGSTLITPHGAFLVTSGCVATPLIPVYLAGLIALPLSRGRRAVGLLAAAPLFFALGIARLLVLALPGSLLPAPALAVHAFTQILAGAALVATAGFWWGRHHGGSRDGLRRALLAVATGAGVLVGAGSVWNAGVTGATGAIQWLLGHAGHASSVDTQGAFSMLPVYQLVLFVSLWVAVREAGTRRRFGAGLLLLGVTQVALGTVAGELSHHVGFAPHVGLIRAWGIVVPVALVWSLVSRPVLAPFPAPEPAFTERPGPGRADRGVAPG